MNIRSYVPDDYQQLKVLYLDSSTFGGQFDEARDGEERLRRKIEADSDAILVAEQDGTIVGTVSIIDDGRVAWLFRFAIIHGQADVAVALHDAALTILKDRGHMQVLVYTPAGVGHLDERYEQLGFTKGSEYTCYWKELS